MKRYKKDQKRLAEWGQAAAEPSMTLFFGCYIFTGYAHHHPAENKEAIATHGKVLHKGHGMMLC